MPYGPSHDLPAVGGRGVGRAPAGGKGQGAYGGGQQQGQASSRAPECCYRSPALPTLPPTPRGPAGRLVRLPGEPQHCCT